MSCSSRTACTAVGDATNSATTLIERWNGSRWSIQQIGSGKIPYLSGNSDFLLGVSCASDMSCTAVGETSANDCGYLLEQWDGIAWSSPDVNYQCGDAVDGLNAVSCTSDTACVSVGDQDTGGCSGVDFRSPLLGFWNGSAWTLRKLFRRACAGGPETSFTAVSCSSITACTAVGYKNNRQLVDRWNGTRWLIQRAPAISPLEGTSDNPPLQGVACPSTTICVAVGQSSNAQLAERRSGGRWSIQNTPILRASQLAAVSCPSTTMCTAVGSFKNSARQTVPLAETITYPHRRTS